MARETSAGSFLTSTTSAVSTAASKGGRIHVEHAGTAQSLGFLDQVVEHMIGGDPPVRPQRATADVDAFEHQACPASVLNGCCGESHAGAAQSALVPAIGAQHVTVLANAGVVGAMT